jgi:hypothetical protein
VEGHSLREERGHGDFRRPEGNLRQRKLRTIGFIFFLLFMCKCNQNIRIANE